jgi:hypothetical protein
MALAQNAGLSRSAFMARFVRAIGCSPIVARSGKCGGSVRPICSPRGHFQLSRSRGRSVIRAAAAFSVPFAKCMDTSRQNLMVMDRTPVEDTAVGDGSRSRQGRPDAIASELRSMINGYRIDSHRAFPFIRRRRHPPTSSQMRLRPLCCGTQPRVGRPTPELEE